VVGCVYRPPNTDVSVFNLELLSILNKLERKKSRPTIIAGDFNLDLLKSEVHAPTGEFLNSLTSHSFMPTIFYPTRITGNSGTLIDNIFFNSILYKYDTAIIYSDVSDHLPVAIHIDLHVSKKNPVQTKKRYYTPEKIQAFKQELSIMDWSIVSEEIKNVTDPNRCYTLFINTFSQIFEKYFPLITVKIANSNSPRKCWITKGLIKSCKRKSKLYKKYINCPTKLNKKIYTDYRNKLKSLLRKAETSYYKNQLDFFAGDLRQTWKLLNKVLNKNGNNCFTDTFMKEDGSIITDHREIVEHFNDFFINIGDKLSSCIPQPTTKFNSFLKGSYKDSFAMHLTNSSEVIEVVHGFCNKRSYGADSIPVCIMKDCIEPISELLSRIINSSILSGCFPNELKIAKVCPVYKSGSRASFSNYRPISVLPSFSKIFEKIACKRLEAYINSKNILEKNQFGFRRIHSTYMAILDMYDKISESIDKHEVSIGVFIDLSKAFDTINHKILIDKLEHYGIRGVPLQWFKDYLSNRKQYVYYNNTASSLQTITCGVPQGSILGPLLFVLYVNDMMNCSKLLHFILFADDTNLFYCNKNYEDLMKNVNLELSKLSEWFRANRLSLNISKTNYILFGNRRRCLADTKFNICIDGNIIERVCFTKFLGVYIDEDLNFKHHTAQISKKISKSLGILNRVKYILPRKTLVTLYRTMIHPYLSYCNIIWGGASLLALNRLICLQKRAVRLITCSYFRAPSNPIFDKLGILKLQDVYKYEILMFVFKFKYNMLPACCMHLLQQRSTSGHYYLRKEPDFVMSSFRTLSRKRSVTIAGPELWNALPDLVKSSATIMIYKSRLLDFLKSSYCKPICNE
jgi:hypothetical protein